MKLIAMFLLLIGIVYCSAPVMWADDKPSSGVPDLQPLGHFVGSWRFMLNSKGEAPEYNWIVLGKITGKWILDGKFIELSFVGSGPDGSGGVKGRVLMTYDEKKTVYRIWSFVSDGTAVESKGTWDQESRTMTWVYGDDENNVTTNVEIAEKGIASLKFVITDRTKKVLYTVFGKFTRQKEEP
jgi:hypothetical protein